MKTYIDLWHWLRDNKGLNVAEVLSDIWEGSKSKDDTREETLSEVLNRGFDWGKQDVVYNFDYWSNIHDELLDLESPLRITPKQEWKLTATFDGEIHVLTGSTKKELIRTLAMLIVEVTKEKE